VRDGQNRQDARMGMGRWVFERSCKILRLTIGVVPDIQTVGKGLNGGYQALSAVLIQQRVVDGLKSGSGAFANGQTFQCHPAAAAAGVAVLSVFEEDAIVATCAKRGAEVGVPYPRKTT
jgi:adenosylmethionine-8-amino-7-oxononanoate aminotransferase